MTDYLLPTSVCWGGLKVGRTNFGIFDAGFLCERSVDKRECLPKVSASN